MYQHCCSFITAVWRPTNSCSRRWRWWCCCYTTFLAIMVLLALALIIFSQEPRVSPSVHPHYVFRNSTVELLFDYKPILDRIALALDKNCGTKLYQIQDQDCRTLRTLNTSYVDPNDKVDNIYMLPGSVIHFTVNPGTSGQIWVLSDYDSASTFGIKPPDCFQPPPGAYCFQAAEHPGNYLYTIKQPANYFIRFYPKSTARDVKWYFNRTIFDIEAIDQHYNGVPLTQVPTVLSFPFPYKTSCILLDIPALSRCYSGKLLATNVLRQNWYLIFLAIPVFICVIILIVLATVHVCCHRRRSSSS